MINLFDIMRQARSGTAVPSLAQQFGLDGVQTQQALEALLPAFSLAFQRNVQDPAAFARLLGPLASGRYAPFFDGSGGWSPPAAASGGQDVLGALFGSPEATGQVARQAAAATGLGVQVLQEMMPVLAATLVGGMFRYASVEGFADVLRTWSDALRTAAPAPPRPAPPAAPWSAWFEMMNAMVPPGQRASQPSPPAARPLPDPFAAWAGLMGDVAGATRPAPPAPPPTPNPFEAITQMFDTGREVQTQHLASLQSILDAAWGGRRAD